MLMPSTDRDWVQCFCRRKQGPLGALAAKRFENRVLPPGWGPRLAPTRVPPYFRKRDESNELLNCL